MLISETPVSFVVRRPALALALLAVVIEALVYRYTSLLFGFAMVQIVLTLMFVGARHTQDGSRFLLREAVAFGACLLWVLSLGFAAPLVSVAVLLVYIAVQAWYFGRRRDGVTPDRP